MAARDGRRGESGPADRFSTRLSDRFSDRVLSERDPKGGETRLRAASRLLR